MIRKKVGVLVLSDCGLQRRRIKARVEPQWVDAVQSVDLRKYFPQTLY